VTTPPRAGIRWKDGRRSFGWLSILLHWLSAAAILTLLFVGNSIQAGKGLGGETALRLHTTIALSAYALLWVRIAWRVASRHPDRLPRQGRYGYALARYFHWLMLAALAILLVTGPFMAWSGGLPLDFYGFEIPAPIDPAPELFVMLHAGHVFAASALGWSVLFHFLAVIKHIAIDRDGSFDRMMIPADESSGTDTVRRA
jgi:cytochrome b561